jgi:DNA primase
MKQMNGDAKEEVRAKLDIEAVVGEYVQLKRAGRNWKGLSPFSDEKTPSFFVSPDKGIWHDFSSNQGGDVFSFVMMVEGLDFRGALEHLARKAGVDLSQYEQKSGASRDIAAKKKRLLAMHETAATYYQRSLLAHPEAISYVKQRGLNRQVVHDFRLGYAPPDGRSLLAFLMKKGYTTKELRDGGLIGSRGSDLFRDRLMVPLMDGQGQVIGFTARLVRDVPGAPKYLNTPQTLLYDKGRHVFGLHLAKEAIRKKDRGVIVEGNLDVISSHQAEVANVVATAGTALTDHHLKALSRLTDHIVLAFDADKAGIAATERAIPIAEAVDVELSIVTLPDDAKDPDELIQRDVKAWERAIKRSRPAIEWVIEQYESRSDLSTAMGKRQLTTKALTLLSVLDNAVEQEHYLQQLAEKTDTTLDTLRARMSQLSDAVTAPKLKPIKSNPVSEEEPNPKQDHLLALLCFGDDIRDVAMELSVDAFDGEARQALFRYLVRQTHGLSLDAIPPELQPYETYVKIVQLKAETSFTERTAQERQHEASHLVGQIKQQHLKQKKTLLTSLLRDAEAGGNEADVQRLMSELNALIKEENTRGKTNRN